MKLHEFLVRKDDLSKTRVVERAVPELQANGLLLKVQQFGLTTNNITYGAVGDRFGYWNFFPADDGWGIIPVWGIGEVVETRHPEIKNGECLYGYFPMASHLAVTAGKVNAQRVVDIVEHRRRLPPVYNNYARLACEPGYEPSLDRERLALLPLYATSYCIYDYLRDNNWFGATQVAIVSASSKTAIGLAYALHDDKSGPGIVGITSSRNLAAVEHIGLYGQVVSYDDFEKVDASKATVIVDMAGDGKFLSGLHRHLGDNMKYCSNVGFTHIDAEGAGPGYIRHRSEFFFAPNHIKKRADEWGPGEFERRSLVFWRDAAIRSREWLTIERLEGAAALESIFHELRQSKIAPSRGIVVSL